MDENLPPAPDPRAVPNTAEPRLELSAAESSVLTRASFKTAIRRRGPSRPATVSLPLAERWIALSPVDEQFGDILDYGCGTGADVRYYLNQGLDAEGYDPHAPFGYAELPRRQFRVVTVIFVLNVLPTAPERLEVLHRAASFLAPAGLLVVAARSTSAIRDNARDGCWRALNDGFVSHERRSTFQHGMDDQEIQELGGTMGLRPAEALPRVPETSLVAFTNDTPQIV